MTSQQTIQGLRSGQYKGSKRVKISRGITEFPREILDLFNTLEILDLSGNPLSTLPKYISRLHKLKIAFFSDCNFTVFPKELAQCRSLEMIAFKGNGMTTVPEGSFPRKLRWLILTNNQISSLPTSIGQCHRLQKCMLAGNQLTSLPNEMAHCRKLGLLRLSANKLTSIPSWLFSLPELSFLSFAGNPCTPSFEDNPVLDTIAWSSLSVQHLLGEGASGIISQGTWKHASTAEKAIAIKLFKGAVTSDGSPIDEMNACITAGRHPNLIDPIGKIHDHPEEKRGLVLELIPPSYKNLGLPPTLESCTRDAFQPEMVLSVDRCKSILRGIAAAAMHLHERGIAHGDLYAHNILIDDKGHALLGDFGAATIYGKDHEMGDRLERMEVFAFGHLIEDLLGLVERRVDEDSVMGEKDAYVVEGLNLLHWRCTDPVVEERPLFVEVHEVLAGL
ncbi:serine/threonine protein kinase-like protein [Hyaloscypha variabilis F]|uniref:Serine/threonine protein kinase-like protein n=1 Tax=Hyaloscypha variabilis (strain UAMH 11265 / GT02V1 / F) TaxID=1149755 RepID=A0A2J6RJ64_HYAVF|nr:serine/threonine protein kinase-like protein [Hyaloscypha variabilis F]